MGSELFPILIVGFVVLIVVVAYYQKKAADARMAALGAFASANGFQFLPGLLPGTVPGGFFASLFGDSAASEEGRFLWRFQNFEPFMAGHSPEVRNLMYGKRGDLDWAVFDYSYQETHSDGKTTSNSTYPFTVVVSRLPVLLPPLTMRPENFLLRIGSHLGMQDLQFESEEFNRKYVVQCPDQKGAYDVLHPQAIEFLMSIPPRLWQMAGFQILLVQQGYQNPDVFSRMMDEIDGFCRLLPGYVKQDRGFTARFDGPF